MDVFLCQYAPAGQHNIARRLFLPFCWKYITTSSSSFSKNLVVMMFFHEVFDFSAIKCTLCVVGTGVLRFNKDYVIALFVQKNTHVIWALGNSKGARKPSWLYKLKEITRPKQSLPIFVSCSSSTSICERSVQKYFCLMMIYMVIQNIMYVCTCMYPVPVRYCMRCRLLTVFCIDVYPSLIYALGPFHPECYRVFKIKSTAATAFPAISLHGTNYTDKE